MKTMIAAAVALAMATGTALADGGNGGPLPLTTPFAIWQQESASGKPLTPTSELLRMADNGQRSNGLAQNIPAQTPSVVTAQNGRAVHAYATQSGHDISLFAPAQNGND